MLKKLISVVTVALGLVFASSFTAQALVTPSSGPLGGGTTVTVDQIRFTKIAASNPGSFTLGLTSDGTVFAWGDNQFGQLGNGTTVRSFVPVAVKGVGGIGVLTDVVAIAAGYQHSVAVTSNGNVYAWGQNNYGQLGDGSNSNSLTPVKVVGSSNSGFLSGITSVSAGAGHTVALSSTGEVFTWGQGTFGQLGNGSWLDKNIPQQVVGIYGSGGTLANMANITKIAAGNRYVLAVTDGGFVVSWGENNNGQLGDGTTTNSNFPTEVMQSNGVLRLSSISDVSAKFHSVALTQDGHVYAWGGNWSGQLGNGIIGVDSYYPQQVLGIGGTGHLDGITAVATGSGQTFAVTSGGNLIAFGGNWVGQLGNGTFIGDAFPQYVPDPSLPAPALFSGVTSVVAGYEQTVVLKSPGVIYSWGGNSDGQFGNGTQNSSTTPVLGPNFQPVDVTFGGVSGLSLSASGVTITVTTPAHAAGIVPVVGTANLFGGVTPAVPSSVSWSAGTFEYLPVAPTISNPTNQSIQSGNTAIFSVTATGTPTPTVTWEVSTNGGVTWQSITTDSSASVASDGLSVSVVGSSTNSGYRYRATASNGASPDAISSAGVLAVSSPVSVTPTPAPTASGNTPSSTQLAITGMNTGLTLWVLVLAAVLVAGGGLVIGLKRKAKK